MIADKDQIVKLLQRDVYSSYKIAKLLDGKISETMLNRYKNGLNPHYEGKNTNKADVGNISLDNAIALTNVATEILGSNMKTKQQIQKEIVQLETELQLTSGSERILELTGKINALKWVLTANEPFLIM